MKTLGEKSSKTAWFSIQESFKVYKSNPQKSPELCELNQLSSYNYFESCYSWQNLLLSDRKVFIEFTSVKKNWVVKNSELKKQDFAEVDQMNTAHPSKSCKFKLVQSFHQPR